MLCFPHEPQSAAGILPADRSEEHTSELQSPCNLVCRLLLEKKKKTSLDFHSPAHCSMILRCCSNHSCFSFLADVLVLYVNFLYFLFICSNTFLFSFAFRFFF